MNGTGTQAGLKQVIAERAQADLAPPALGRLVISSPSRRPRCTVSAEDVAGSPFGLKLSSVSSSLTGATVTGPSGSPAAVSVDLGATNPNPGDQVSFTFNLPDGTTAFRSTDGNEHHPAADRQLHHRRHADGDGGNLNTALNSVDRHARQYDAGGGFRG